MQYVTTSEHVWVIALLRIHGSLVVSVLNPNEAIVRDIVIADGEVSIACRLSSSYLLKHHTCNLVYYTTFFF